MDTSFPSFETLISYVSLHCQQKEQLQADDDQSSEEILRRCFFTHQCRPSIIHKTKVKDERLPWSFQEAWNNSSWAEVIDGEYHGRIDCGTCMYIERKPEIKVLPYTWNFRIKDGSSGNVILFKARRCLCGNLKLAYHDFEPNNLLAPVVEHETIRMFLAKVAAQKLNFEDADVDNFYLYGDLEKPIDMKQPADSFCKVQFSGIICFILKWIYGALQAGIIWGSSIHIHKTLLESNFLPIITGPATIFLQSWCLFLDPHHFHRRYGFCFRWSAAYRRV